MVFVTLAKEVMETFVVEKDILIGASKTVVWDALTNPDKTKKYFFNCKVISDWKPGSSIVFKGNFLWLIPITFSGTITEINPGESLQYTLDNKSDHSGVSLVTIALKEENQKTRVFVSDDVGDGAGAPKRYRKSQKGWDTILNGLKKFIETNNTN